MTKKLFLLLLFSCIILQSYSQLISGFVYDNHNIPLSNANVYIEGTNNGTITDGNGKFQLSDISFGTYSISASYMGFQSKTVTIEVKSNNVFVNFILDEIPVSLPEVIIQTPSSNYTDLINIPVRTKIIDAQEIQQIPSISTSKIFNTVSGINVSSEFGIFSSSTVVSLRGLGGSSQTGTLVVLDGMPLNKSDGGSVNWNIIDKDNISKIEIIKGPGSVLFGSNAMGGIINIISKSPENLLEGNVSISYGTYHTIEEKFNISGTTKTGLLFWRSYIHHRTSDGYINTPEEVINENDSIIVPVYIKEFFAGGLVGLHVNENHSIEFSANYFNDIRGRGIEIFEETGSNINRNTYQFFIKHKGQINKFKIFSTAYSLTENYFRLNEYYSDGEYKLYEVDADRQDFGYRFWSEVSPVKKLTIVLGAEMKKGQINGSDVYYTSTDVINNRGEMDIISAFIQGTYVIYDSKWSFVPGIRYDYALFHDASFSIDKPSYSIEYLTDFQFSEISPTNWNSFSPKFTLQYSSTKRLKYYFSIAKGFRAPLLDDLCRSENVYQGFRAANPNIKPEYILNYECGMDLTLLKKLKTGLSVYNTQGFNFMYLLTTGDSVNLGYTIAPVYQMDNISKVNIFGIETDIEWSITKNMLVYFNYTYNQSTIVDFKVNTPIADRDLNGKFLTNIPKHKFSYGINIKSKIADFSFAGKYTGTRWIKDDNSIDYAYMLTDQFPAYMIVDARLRKKFKNFDVSFDVDNLLNTIYINSKGYQSPGRMFFIKFIYNFKIE
jgi:outer membrane receptor protein involved in Fe transport